MNSEIVRIVTNALEEYEDSVNHKIDILESRILGYEKERQHIINCLKENNIDLLKLYFNIV